LQAFFEAAVFEPVEFCVVGVFFGFLIRIIDEHEAVFEVDEAFTQGEVFGEAAGDFVGAQVELVGGPEVGVGFVVEQPGIEGV